MRSLVLCAAVMMTLRAPATWAQTPTMLSEDFDCYEPGAWISTLGGWELWPGGADASVTDERAFSGDHSLHLSHRAAVVHQFSGYYRHRLTWRMMVYVPGSSLGLRAHVVALNQYDGGGPETSWSVLIDLDSDAGVLSLRPHGVQAPLTFDRWFELRIEARLDWAEFDLYYDGDLIAGDVFWFECPHCSGLDDLAAIELFVSRLDAGPGGEGVFIDDVMVAPAGVATRSTCGELCYADCDGSGAIDFFDYLCFQNHFAAGDPRADCDQDGALTFVDFLCFQAEFAAGCG